MLKKIDQFRIQLYSYNPKMTVFWNLTKQHLCLPIFDMAFVNLFNLCKLGAMQKHFQTMIIVLIMISCSKDDDISVEDRREALFGQWEYEAIMSDTAVDINGDGTVNIDLYNTNEIRQCLKDNLTFFTDGPAAVGKDAFSINENGLSCGEVDPFSTVESDEFELIDNETLRFDGRNDMRIVSFTLNRLVLEQDDFLDDQGVVITYTYKRS